MKLPDSTRDHLLHASASWEAVDAMETFSNGLAGHYHYIKYVVVQKQNLWSTSYDVAIALHVEQWNFGLTDGKWNITGWLDIFSTLRHTGKMGNPHNIFSNSLCRFKNQY